MLQPGGGAAGDGLGRVHVMDGMGACAWLQASGTSDIESTHFPLSTLTSEVSREALAPRPPLPTPRQSPSSSPPPLPSREDRDKKRIVRREPSDSPPPVPARPTTLPLHLSGEQACRLPKPFNKTPSSPMLRAVSDLRNQKKKRASDGEYIWVKPEPASEGKDDEPPPIPPVPARWLLQRPLSAGQSEEDFEGGEVPGPEYASVKQSRTRLCTASNALYDYIIPIDTPSSPPPEPPHRHDSLFLDADTPVSLAPATPDSPGSGKDIGAVRKAVCAAANAARPPAEAQELNDHGHAAPRWSSGIEMDAPTGTGTPPQRAATQVRRTWRRMCASPRTHIH